MRLRRISVVGEHNVTVPDHKVMAKGTLNDILTRASVWTGLSKEDLVKRLS